jgi:hypothetical protein
MFTIVPLRARRWGSAACYERDRCEGVHLVHVCQHGEGVFGDARLGRRTEHARVVHEQVDASELQRGGGQIGAVRGVGDITWDRANRVRTEVGDSRGERVRVTRVDDEVPAIGRERGRECEPQTAGRAGLLNNASSYL